MNIKKGDKFICIRMSTYNYIQNPIIGRVYSSYSEGVFSEYEWLTVIDTITGEAGSWKLQEFRRLGDDHLIGLDKEINDIQTMGYKEW
jgi:hypothetical protein